MSQQKTQGLVYIVTEKAPNHSYLLTIFTSTQVAV